MTPTPVPHQQQQDHQAGDSSGARKLDEPGTAAARNQP
jgi:hypothetical protein